MNKEDRARYMREYRQRNLIRLREQDREWAKAKPSRTPEARKAKADAAYWVRVAEEMAEWIPCIVGLLAIRREMYLKSKREAALRNYYKYQEQKKALARKRVKQERVDHPDRVRARGRARHKRDQAKIVAGTKPRRIREWDTPERKKAKAKYFEANRAKYKVYKHERRARENEAEGSFTPAEVEALLVTQAGKCAYCAKDISSGYHIEHKVPLGAGRGGTNWISNIALSCAWCNKSKGTKTDEEFAAYLKRRAEIRLVE
jgi:5-methylcytosine-specific restriction endonuclease McrA